MSEVALVDGFAEEGPGQTEVQDLHPAVGGDLDVGLLKTVGDLTRDLQGFFQGKRSLFDAKGEVLALGQLHHQKPVALELLDPVEPGDVGVVQRGEGAGFSTETSDPFRIVEQLVGKDLEGDLTIQLGVTGAVDLTHAASAEQVEDLEVSDGLADQRAGLLGQGASILRCGRTRVNRGAPALAGPDPQETPSLWRMPSACRRIVLRSSESKRRTFFIIIPIR